MRIRNLFATVAALVCAASAEAQDSRPTPLNPIDTILGAFASHRVVALGEGGHGNEQSHAFRLSLIRDPRFAAVVNDIAVEFGSGAYQDLIDRFVRGEEVSNRDLRQVWQNTSVEGTVWDRPIYEAFYREVRDINSRLSKDRQLRVLLGDAPIDWSRINGWSDYVKHSRTDAFPAGVVQRESIDKGRRALILYGEGHYHRQKAYWMLKDAAVAEARFAKPMQSIVTLIEAKGTKVFSIATPLGVDWSSVEPEVATWTPPKIAILKDSTIGAQPYTKFYGGDMYIMIDDEKGIEERVRNDPNRTPTMEQQFDAMLYLGPRSTLSISKLAPELCRDSEYMGMRLKRIQIGSPPGWTDASSSLKNYCASIPPN